MSEIHEHEVYSINETQELLKVSKSTIMRMIKSGVLKAGKFGGQYRILGRELLRHLLPKEDYIEIAKKFQKVKKWVKE